MRLAVERLESEAHRSRTERERTVPIEEGVPETSPVEEVSTLGDEILDFFQPEEWRRALLLYHGGDVRGADLAKVDGSEEPGEIEHVLERARAFLRQKLVEARCLTPS